MGEFAAMLAELSPCTEAERFRIILRRMDSAERFYGAIPSRVRAGLYSPPTQEELDALRAYHAPIADGMAVDQEKK